jgi:hypothetical protein
MEARQGTQQRFVRRDGGERVLAEAPPLEAGATLELDAAELLTRLEQQAAANARLEARADALERKALAERDARRRLAATLKREREAAAALHERAEQHRAAHAAAVEELERVREDAWSRLAESQRPVAEHELGFWRGLLQRASRGA